MVRLSVSRLLRRQKEYTSVGALMGRISKYHVFDQEETNRLWRRFTRNNSLTAKQFFKEEDARESPMLVLILLHINEAFFLVS